nr:hypothetical protein [Streptomyces sp. SPB162]
MTGWSSRSSTGVEDYDPAWHPNGDDILFVRAGSKGARTLASVDTRGGAVTVVRTTTTGLLSSPAVSRDGQVAYVQVAETVPFAYAPASVLMVDGEPVTDGEDVAPLPPCWTADGKLLYTADGPCGPCTTPAASARPRHCAPRPSHRPNSSASATTSAPSRPANSPTSR